MGSTSTRLANGLVAHIRSSARAQRSAATSEAFAARLAGLAARGADARPHGEKEQEAPRDLGEAAEDDCPTEPRGIGRIARRAIIHSPIPIRRRERRWPF